MYLPGNGGVEWMMIFSRNRASLSEVLATYCIFVPQILVDIEAGEKPEFDCRTCKLEDYPGIKEKLDRMVDMLKDYQGFMDSVHAKVLEGFKI
jgi:hypothetical protein